MTQPIRLVHASDLHLEQPICGLAEVPEHLRELLLEAPYQAAEQVFETALAENADALLLAGDVLHVDRAGPPAIVLLLDQFARLGDRGIQVYWAGGEVDLPDLWPRSVALPDNVHVFPIGRVETLDVVRSGDTIARVQGTSCRDGGEIDVRGFHRDAHGLFTVGVAHLGVIGDRLPAVGQTVVSTTDTRQPTALADRVPYMALGGRHARQTVDEPPGIAHYCGTPQGRSPAEVGSHGCTVVTVDESSHAKTRFVATDAVRWSELALEVTASTRSEQLHERMIERLEKLQAQQPAIDHLVRWTVRGTGPLVNRLRPGGLADELLVDLRRKFGERSPVAWSASIECSAALSVPAEWYDQETCLGEFLRQVRALELDEQLPLDLQRFLPENLGDASLAKIAQVDAVAARGELLCRAAKLGVDLLTPPIDEGDIPNA
jgi:DNA repair exonuclease SbcCD nuclease subunit